jgi:NAD(P)-dependent dehydrogenase (short-subunit alcohol dehydrogenase family)
MNGDNDDPEGARTTMRFEGRKVIVTGGSRGIGRGIVDAFLDEGARVLATDVLDDGLARVRDGHPHVDRLAVHTADLADVEQVGTIVPAAVKLLGGVDVLVNNAGLQPDQRALDITPDEFDATFAVNVRAPMLLMQDVARRWIDQGARGAIVNIASANAFQNESPESIYNASKAALVALTKAFAHEFGHYGIRANVVAPGETITPEAEREMAEDPRGRELVRRYLAKIPLQHAGTPRDQAMAVLFLASDDARFISAQTLIVDGGELGGGSWYDPADAPPPPPADRPITG